MTQALPGKPNGSRCVSSPASVSTAWPGAQCRPVVGRASAALATRISIVASWRSWAGVRVRSTKGPPSMVASGWPSNVRSNCTLKVAAAFMLQLPVLPVRA